MATPVRPLVTGHRADGRSTVLLDDRDVRLKAGDVVVRQATNHAWINRGSATCRLAMVFVDAEEPEVLA